MDFSFANARLEKAYFFKADQDLIKKLHEQEDARLNAELKASHHMICPKCGHDLRQTKLSSLTVDRCTGCDGVFFDKEEWSQFFDNDQPQHNFIDTLHSLLVGDNKS